MTTNRFLTIASGVRRLVTAISATTGASDANKIVATDSGGRIADSFLLLGLLKGYINGLILTNNATDTANDIDFGTGVAYCGDRVVENTATLTKRLDATWAGGTGNGGLFSGTKANSTTYHCFILRNQTTNAVDFGFDTSVSGANKPSGYDARRIGAVLTDGSGNIRQFYQVGDWFGWKSPVKDFDAASISSAGTLLTLTLPTGIVARVQFSAYYTGSTTEALYFSSPQANNETQDFTAGRIHMQSNSVAPGFTLEVLTNTAAQIRVRSINAPATDTLKILTIAYRDPRGRD